MESKMKPTVNGKEAKYLCDTCGFLANDSDDHDSAHMIIKMIPCMTTYYELYNEQMKLTMKTTLNSLFKKQFDNCIEGIKSTISKQQRMLEQAIKALTSNNKKALTIQNIELLVGNCKSGYNSIKKNQIEANVVLLKQKFDHLLDQLSAQDNIKLVTKGGTANIEKIEYEDAVYIGATLNGKRDGIGKLTYNDGDIYDGEWKNDQKEGKGIYKWGKGKWEGDIYDGEWKNGQQEGKGIYKFIIGDIYDGEWKNGQQEGKGVLKFKSGDIYDGEWKNDQREGKGVFKFKSGDIYLSLIHISEPTRPY